MYTADNICKMIEFLIDNIFVQFGGRLFLSIDFNSLWTSEISDKSMTAGVCHISDSYINVWISGQSAQDSQGGICGFRLTVFWWASCEDSICWWEKFYKLKEI